MSRFGCVEFHAVTEGEHEVALSYWPDEQGIRAWRNHPEHVLAQQSGRDRWYESYSVQVAEITREYRVPARIGKPGAGSEILCYRPGPRSLP